MSRSLFKKRVNPKPFLYPELLEFKDAIRHSYWLHTEFNFTSDIQNYHVDVSEYEKNTITKAMLAISQIEVSVKTFWTRLYDYLPAYEISDVGVTFGESECFVEGTEVLTPEGWKDFRDLDEEHLVLQFDGVNRFQYTPIQEIIVKDYNDDLIEFKNDNIDVRVTKNHRVIYFENNELKEKLAKDITPDDALGIPYCTDVEKDYNMTLAQNDLPVEINHIPYNGKVYCVSVDSTYIVVRYNGKVSVSGNCRHFDAYSFLLEKLGMNDLFERLHEFPALMKRVEYMEDFMKRKNEDRKGMVLSLVLFSLFIEHISLFSQFYIMMSYNKFKNLFKGISNAIEATSKEEEIHGRFGIQLFQILHVEHNELFTPDFYEDLKHLASKAFEAEMGIVDWIYEGGDLDFARKDVVKAFIANRYNKSLDTLGVDLDFPVDEELLKETTWFDVEVLSTKETDFFSKRSTDYSKKQKQITADDLF